MQRRLSALVIGNSEYIFANPLTNATNDADDIAAQLIACGFEVIRETDCTTEQMERALESFQKKLVGREVGLFFFAGHGIQVGGENFLAGTDMSTNDEISAKYTSLPLNRVIEMMEGAGVDSSIIILDACRDNPFERSWTRSVVVKGLAPVYAPKGTLIAYATSPGQTALDGAKGGRNGRYTAALLKHIRTPDVSIETMFKRVRNTLNTSTKGKQISWEHTSLSGEFFFNLSVGARVDIYAPTSISDSLFILDNSKYSHRLIRALKSCTWPTQNAALEEFTLEKIAKCNSNSLFVIGRNIYQAACGNSHEAVAYISEFMERTVGVPESKRKAILDGILFEIFFDKRGELRQTTKGGRFSAVFALQVHTLLKDSFAFIAECLLPYSSRFYAIPGKPHRITVDVAVIDLDSGFTVESVCVSGRNILEPEDEDWVDDDGKPIKYKKITHEALVKRLEEEMLVPAHLLNVTYSKTVKPTEQVRMPQGWSTSKRESL